MIAEASVVARAPVRISFGGGGTDLAAYYGRFGGLVVSSSITRYCYAVARPAANGSIRINSGDYRLWQSWEQGLMPPVEEPLILPKAVIEWFAARGLAHTGVDLYLSAEVPPGTGLGSSSAMTVALIAALSAFLHEPMGPAETADLACRLEIDRLGMPIGKQDQYASSFGGLNAIRFCEDGVEVTPLQVGANTYEALNAHLLLFSTGRSRHSSGILGQQRADTSSKQEVIESLHQLKDLALEMRTALEGGRLDEFGHLLDCGWQLKRGLSGRVSSADIDRWYAGAREAGAVGGKITGAGGGGFLLLYCPPAAQPQVRATLEAQGLCEMPFDLDRRGAHVLTERDDHWHTAVSNIVGEHVLAHKRLRRTRQAPDRALGGN